MKPLENRHILVGITGGIAAYKTPWLVRLLRQAGAEVQVVMTESAARFVTATTLQAVSGRPVRDTLWDPAAEAQMGHIELARWADLLLIAPATADRLSRLASGHADDLLGAVCLASRAPIAVAPAMNQAMWAAAATQRNLSTLIADGVHVIGPDEGDQACGDTGPGRMVEPEVLVDSVTRLLEAASTTTVTPLETGVTPWSGRHVVITAGPTREAIDPVRFISNHSSGKQGYALARAAADAGARVTLISGPVAEPVPAGVERISVVSAEEMLEASLEAAKSCDLFIAVAAVADYRPATTAVQKLKKNSTGGRTLSLELVENPDVVASIAALPDRPMVVGFAAETENTRTYAREKLIRKNLDAIVANDVSRDDIGFGAEENAVTLIWRQNGEVVERVLGKQSKASLASVILNELGALFVRQLAHTNPENVAH